jgi:hypothetical protein
MKAGERKERIWGKKKVQVGIGRKKQEKEVSSRKFPQNKLQKGSQPNNRKKSSNNNFISERKPQSW